MVLQKALRQPVPILVEQRKGYLSVCCNADFVDKKRENG